MDQLKDRLTDPARRAVARRPAGATLVCFEQGCQETEPCPPSGVAERGAASRRPRKHARGRGRHLAQTPTEAFLSVC